MYFIFPKAPIPYLIQAPTKPAAGIDEACPQGCRRPLLRGEEATLGATAARKQPARQPRTSPESPAAAQLSSLSKIWVYPFKNQAFTPGVKAFR
jgi:hypothetical protein